MISETRFLQPIVSTQDPNPNFVNATGSTVFTNYSQSPSGTLTDAQVETLAREGVATAIAEAGATIFVSAQ